jgi:hypothetical protein
MYIHKCLSFICHLLTQFLYAYTITNFTLFNYLHTKIARCQCTQKCEGIMDPVLQIIHASIRPWRIDMSDLWGRNILDEKAITKEFKHLACEPLPRQRMYLRLDAIHCKVRSLQVLDGLIVNLINWEGGGLSLSVGLLIEFLLRHSWDTYARQLRYIDKCWTCRLHFDTNGWCNSCIDEDEVHEH